MNVAVESKPVNYQKEHRKRARANGLCGVCCSQKPERKPRDGLATCDWCLGKDDRIEAARRALDEWCDDCQAISFHRDGCPNDRREL